MSDKLKASWNKKEKDILYTYPRSCDGHLLHAYLGTDGIWLSGDKKPSLLNELEARGYDLTTLKFSIELKRKE